MLAMVGLTLCARIHLLESYPELLRCSTSEGCADLLLDPHLTVLGLFPADLGFFYFVLCLIALVVAASYALGRIVFRLLLWVGFFVALGSLFLQFLVFHKFCPYCLSLDFILILQACLGSTGRPFVTDQKDLIWAALVIGQGLLTLGFTFWGSQAYRWPSAWIVAKVGGQPILSSQMEDQLAITLQPYDEIRYETEKAWLDDKLNQSVLDIEAGTEGLSSQELILRQIGAPHSENDTAWQARKADYLLKLRSKYNAVSYLVPPVPKVIHLDLQDTFFEGSPKAPVQIVVFSDHECPFCKIMAPVLSNFYRSHPSDIALGYWPFPLQAHKQARMAALAAYSAAQQGHFWDYNDLLYAEPILNDATYLRLAKTINLNLVAFETCVRSSAAANFIDDHYQRASSLGINGIPAIFMNGRMVGGTLTKADLENLYQNEMRAQKK